MSKPIGTPGGGKNKKPEILDQTFSIDENSFSGFSAFVAADDPDSVDLTYSIVGGDGTFFIDSNTGEITFIGTPLLDHESLAEYQLEVEVSDGTSTSSATITIEINDVNEAPTAIALDSLVVASGTDGAVVGTFTVTDPDDPAEPFGQHSFDVSDDRFVVVAGQLKLKDGVTIGPSELSIPVEVTATDGGGLSTFQSFILTVTDAPQPPAFSGVIDLGDSTAWDGFTVSGENDDGTGSKVSSAGDVNGDGINDVIIEAGRAAFVVYGKNSDPNDPEERPVEIFTDFFRTEIMPEDGFQIIRGNLEFGGTRSISSAGDINNDGFDDMIIGFSTETSYVIYGKETRTTDIDLYSLAPVDGFQILGESGWSVSEAGDVNGDGIGDLIIGAVGGEGSVGSGGNPNLGSAGDAYVIFGKDSDPEFGDPETFTDIDLANLDLADGFRIIGAIKHGGLGSSVSSAGDINNDGIDDLVIGASGVATSGKPGDALNAEGVSYVIYGKDSEAGDTFTDIDIANFAPEDGFRIIGADTGDRLGRSVSDAGDVNGDGIDDLIFGVGLGDGDNNLKETTGESYVIFGKNSNPEFGEVEEFTDIDLANLAPTDGIRIIGVDAGDAFGGWVSSAGDVNGDEIDDLLVSAAGADGAGTPEGEAGEVYLIFGKDGLEDIDLANFTADDGIIFLGAGDGDRTGWTVDGAGDINNDGYDDLIIGTLGPVDKDYVVYGGDFSDTSVVEVASLTAETLPDGDFIL
jgi:hypothetical protein